MEGTDLILLGLAVVLLPFAISLFLAAGPLLWFGLGGALVVAGISITVFGETDDPHLPPANCPNCGSPNDPDAEVCDHCGTPIEA